MSATTQDQPRQGQCEDHAKIVGAEIADPVEWQEAVIAVPVDDELGEQDPADEDGCERRELDQCWQRDERDLLHAGLLQMNENGTVPVQARLRSSGLSIGELGQLVGLRPSAIRYYEAAGLIPAPVRRSGRRLYDRQIVDRLRTIMVARELGFSISEIKRLSAIGVDARREAAKARASSLRVLIDELEITASRLEYLSGCECARGGACRL